MFEMKNQTSNSKRNSSMFKVNINEIECHNCHNKGHFQRDCTYPWRGGANGRSSWRGGAYQNQGRGNYQSRGYGFDARGNNFNRGRGRGYVQRGRGRA